MLGFVRFDRNRINLGGEIFRKRQQKKVIVLTILAVLGFVLLNLVLYYFTNI